MLGYPDGWFLDLVETQQEVIFGDAALKLGGNSNQVIPFM